MRGCPASSPISPKPEHVAIQKHEYQKTRSRPTKTSPASPAISRPASLPWPHKKSFTCWAPFLFRFLASGSCRRATFSVQDMSYFRKTLSVAADTILVVPSLGRGSPGRLQAGQTPGCVSRVVGQQRTAGKQPVTSSTPQGLIFEPKLVNRVIFDSDNQ